MGQYDGGNFESQTPMPMPQAQQRRGIEMQENAMRNQQLRRQALREVPPTIYPPQSEMQRYANQPMLDSPAMSQEMAEIQNQAAASMGYMDPVSGSNNVNFSTIGLPFTYGLDQANAGFIELLPGAQLACTISISADADMVVQAISARATREFIYTWVDSGADRRLQTTPLSAIATLGGMGRVFSPTVPMLVKGKTTLQIIIQDGGAGSPNIYNGAPVANANLEPSVADPQVLVNKIGFFLVGVKRLQRG